VNLVLVLRLAQELSELEAHAAIQGAECKVAKRLAGITLGMTSDRTQTYDLSQQKPELPRVVLIQGHSTDAHHSHSGLSYYGLSVRDSLATMIHPNELLDGAIGVNATRAVCHHPTTWEWQNHPLVLGLYQEHGRQLNFAGLILERVRFETHHGKEVIAHNTAELATNLGADGALVTWVGGGNAFVDVMLTIAACEQRGIKTVLVAYEYGGPDGVDSPLLYYVPEARAVITTGSRNRCVDLPEADKVVGPYEHVPILSYPGAPVVSAREPLSLDARDILVGGVDIWGRQAWTCREF
jgi:glycine reductase